MYKRDKTLRHVALAVLALLTSVLGLLKLSGLANMSWWWVVSPFWIGAIIALLFFAAILVSLNKN